jgi:hypothetical protein
MNSKWKIATVAIPLLTAAALCAGSLKIGNSAGWELVTDGQSKIKFAEEKTKTGNILKADVKLKQGGDWIILKKIFKTDIAPDSKVAFKIKANADFDLETNFVKTSGAVHNKRTSLKSKYKDWTTVTVSPGEIKLGWKVKRNPGDGSEFQFGFSGKGSGTVWIDDFKVTGPAAWDKPKDWQVITDGKSSLKLSDGGENSLHAAFDLKETHGWTLMRRFFKSGIAKSTSVTFELKTAFTGDLEVKFIDPDGQVHCRKIRVGKNPGKWQTITVYKQDCDMKWKIGAQKDSELQIGFSGKSGKGSALFRNIRFGAKGSKSTISGKSPFEGTGAGPFGIGPLRRTNALITASTAEKEYPVNAVADGDMKTRWSSRAADNQWLVFKFPAPVYICGMTIFWEAAFTRKFDVLVSGDGNKWSKVFTEKDSDGNTDEILFSGRKVKFVKLDLHKRATGWGNSIWEIAFKYKADEPRVSSNSGNAENAIDGNPQTAWTGTGANDSTLSIDLKRVRQLGGVFLKWGKKYSSNYEIQISENGKAWNKIFSAANGNGATDANYFSPASTRYIKIICRRGKPFELNEIILKNSDEAISPLRYFKAVAAEYPEGFFPRWLYNKQLYWNVIGVDEGIEESLIGEDASVEPFIKSFSVMSYIFDKSLVTAYDVKLSQSLEDNYLPLPGVKWNRKGVELQFKAFAAGTPEKSAAYCTYTLKNSSDKISAGKLYLVIRPIQINPRWQHGGMSLIKNIKFTQNGNYGLVTVNGRKAVYIFDGKVKFGAAAAGGQDIMPSLAKGIMPVNTQALANENGLISAVAELEYKLAPGKSKTFYVIMPQTKEWQPSNEPVEKVFTTAHGKTVNFWKDRLNRIQIDIPNKEIVNVMRANLAYLLINRDKSSLHPGSRCYDRAWIRDGSIMCQALLDNGLFKEVKDFLMWVTSCQMKNGRIPCMLELNGKMPGWSGGWVEWDGQGAYVFAITSYYRFTKDKAFLKKTFPAVIKALKFLKYLRSQQCIEKLKGTVFYGIIPKSNSHEGYFPAMHSLWDDFWALKGWKDGQVLAKDAGRSDLIPWMQKEESELRKNLIENIKLLSQQKDIKNIPGCFDKADFDTTSTAIAVWPCFEAQYLPKKMLRYTFDKYYKDTLLARTKNFNSAYTPYELRSANAFLTMGEKDKVLTMLYYFLQDMRPRKWLHWAEVVYPDYYLASYIGDMPHTWIGAIAINLIRNLFVYERNNIDLVFAAGIDPQWLSSSKEISALNLPTYFGKVGFKMKKTGNTIETIFSGSVKDVRRILLASPLEQKIKSATVDGQPAKIINNEVVIDKYPAKVILNY